MEPLTPPPTRLLPPSPLKATTAFTKAFALFGKRPGLFIGISLLSQAALLIIGAATVLAVAFIALITAAGNFDSLGRVSISSGKLAAGGLAAAVVLLVSAFLYLAVTVKINGMLYVLAIETEATRRPTYRDLSRSTKGLFRRALPTIVFMTAAIVLSIVLSVAILFGIGVSGVEGPTAGIALFIAAIAIFVIVTYVAVRWCFYLATLALETGKGLNPLRRSWHLTKGAFWRVFGRLVLFNIAVGIVWFIVTAALGMAFGAPMEETFGNNPATSSGAVTANILSALLNILFAPLMACFMSILYLDERRRRNEEDPTPTAHVIDAPWQAETAQWGQPQGQRYGATTTEPAAETPQRYGQQPPTEEPRYGQRVETNNETSPRPDEDKNAGNTPPSAGN
ncbi:glycerophosphoryl diester phosphodiesterase membrane domain-containing protein [Dermatophilus congolensis]|uniref:Membrane domain of membrane-anchored glycerophosphoryl diester phosphodiesterase n=7 Tax=Dermatophilus congolensis TaxID=1863 RepID=A0A239VAJ0_9MICO|nr:glycerophosphoryl diester phosphodiesterase membrane domain-containing protein [Dermatophilus congolensis]MBO3130556.1 hypothetical protein [Dermatophilus congolensis]MBO3135029.1 hypothetical protein [Dermatophilus congolensis]MBO3139512.1 hypothetical protein [Dermatophilus congolensis]MBO3153204.1 hypothetical protein [Dermatophilus congolensis]MBO3186800.1 hypothetical protein [Dermatophilus congolensis]